MKLPRFRSAAQKEPFGRLGRMKLPLFLGEKAGKVLIRAVYKYRGGVFDWPSEPKGLYADKDQQGYFAYRVD